MIATMINISELNFETPTKHDSSVLSIVLFVMLAITIVLEVYVISEHRGRYHHKEFKLTYGSIVEGLKTESFVGRYWNILLLIRWAATNVTMVFIKETCTAQIFILLVTSVVFQIMSIIAWPINEHWNRRISLIIEFSVSIYLYALLSLTDFMGENALREEIGWLLVLLTLTIVAINLSFFLS
jgi:hypothetical protein